MAAIDTIPAELLSDILTQLKLTSISSLRNCLLVSKSWHSIARPLLYHTVVLRSPRAVEGFSTHLTTDTSRHVKSLTVQLGSADRRSELLHLLHLLPDALGRLRGLSTFSLFVPPAKRHGINIDDIPRAALVSLVDALPESCVNLEIDTQGRDAMPVVEGGGGEEEEEEEDAHLCDHLRRVLPRMERVRLRLRWMCSALVGTGPRLPCLRPESAENNMFAPVSLPKMRTLLLNCRGARQCGSGSGPERAGYTPWHSLTQGLEQLVQRSHEHGHQQPSAKLYVVDFTIRDTDDKRDYSTFLCAEITTQVTTATPCRVIAHGVENPYLLRTLDGRELFSTLLGLEPLMEGEIWKTAAGGARVPAELVGKLASFPMEKADSRVQTTDEWKSQYPRKSCQLWSNERTANMRLLHAERRRGPEAYLSRDPVVERTPPGFVRSPAEQYITLFRSDDPRIPA